MNLDLLVSTAKELNLSIVEIATNIASAIETLSWIRQNARSRDKPGSRNKRMRHKGQCGSDWIRKIAPSNANTTNIDLTWHANRQWSHLLIKNVDLGVSQRAANRGRLDLHFCGRNEDGLGHIIRAFSWPISIHQWDLGIALSPTID